MLFSFVFLSSQLVENINALLIIAEASFGNKPTLGFSFKNRTVLFFYKIATKLKFDVKSKKQNTITLAHLK